MSLVQLDDLRSKLKFLVDSFDNFKFSEDRSDGAFLPWVELLTVASQLSWNVNSVFKVTEGVVASIAR